MTDRVANLKEMQEYRRCLKAPKRRRKLNSVHYRQTHGIDGVK